MLGNGCGTFVLVSEFDGDQLRNAGFLHGDPVHRLSRLHGLLGVGDHDELGILRHLLQKPGQTQDIGLIERGIDFVEHAEGAGLVAEDRHQKGKGCQGFLAAREQENVLELFAGRRGDDLDARFAGIVFVGEAHFAHATAEEGDESFAEVGVNRLKSLVKARFGDAVDFLDGLFGVADRVEQVLPLGAQEVVPLLRIFKFLKGFRVNGAERFDLGLNLFIKVL